MVQKNYTISVVSNDNSPKGNFSVVEQTINKQGFYYDVPYLLADYYYRVGIMLNKNGTLYLVEYQDNYSYPVQTYSYEKVGDDIICEGFTGVVSDDGKQIYVDGFGTFEIVTEYAVSEGQYFYPTNPWLYDSHPYAFVLDKTKTSYESPLLTVNDKSVYLYGTYKDCVNLKKMTIPYGIEKMGMGCFQNCINLESVTIPKTVKEISNYTFDNCTKLTNISFKGTVDEWNNISKGYNWNSGVSATEVICIDGVVNF